MKKKDIITETYIEEIAIILGVLFLGVCAIIFTTRLSEDYEEKECVKFYIKNKYITKSCDIYREKLEKIND